MRVPRSLSTWVDIGLAATMAVATAYVLIRLTCFAVERIYDWTVGP